MVLNAYMHQDENIPMGTSASAASSLMEKQIGWEQVELFPACESFFLWLSLQTLGQIPMQHTLFFLVLCFA